MGVCQSSRTKEIKNINQNENPLFPTITGGGILNFNIELS